MNTSFFRSASIFASLAVSTPAHALDLNSFRAQHKRPALSVSMKLGAIAQAQADAMATRRRLSHGNFKQRIGHIGTAAAENISYGCADQDCAIAQWARSGRHRSNMLRGDVSAYAIASATDDKGRTYWVLELGGE